MAIFIRFLTITYFAFLGSNLCQAAQEDFQPVGNSIKKKKANVIIDEFANADNQNKLEVPKSSVYTLRAPNYDEFRLFFVFVGVASVFSHFKYNPLIGVMLIIGALSEEKILNKAMRRTIFEESIRSILKLRHSTNLLLTNLGLMGTPEEIIFGKANAESLSNNTLRELKVNYWHKLEMESCYDANYIEDLYNTTLSKLLMTTQSLQKLEFDFSIGTSGIAAIASGLKKNKSLTILNLSCQDITDEGGRLIGLALNGNKSLTILDLSYNKIEEEGGEAIGLALKENKSLTMLDLSGNNFGEKGNKAIGLALETNSTLKKLSISVCNESHFIANSLKKNNNLRELTIYDDTVDFRSEFFKEALTHNISLIDITYNEIYSEKNRLNIIEIKKEIKVNKKMRPYWFYPDGEEGEFKKLFLDLAYGKKSKVETRNLYFNF